MTTTTDQPMATAPASSRVTISLGVEKHDSDSYAAHLIVTGLISENEATNVLTNLQNLLCGSEIATN